MPRLRFSAHALAQLEEAITFIAADDPRAARRMATAIEDAVQRLKHLPASGRVVPELGDPGRREVIVRPFRVVYRVHEDEVRILAIVHGRRLLEDALPDE